jgi:2,3-bisphosphoglycerate-dependent phosphoglycerate mutase
MSKLILLRHGKSVWNEKNIFTGCVDVPLSPLGITEALEAGKIISDIPIDIIYTSVLIRAQMTAMLAMSQNSTQKVPVFQHKKGDLPEGWETIYGHDAREETIPVICAWQLNERMYGELQGMNKAEMAEEFGDAQIKLWRRSYDIAPPKGESLSDTAARTIPYFEEQIMPHLIAGRNVLIAAHGNSLRSIVMDLEGLDHQQVVSLEIATGVPLFYEYRDGKVSRSW